MSLGFFASLQMSGRIVQGPHGLCEETEPLSEQGTIVGRESHNKKKPWGGGEATGEKRRHCEEGNTV